MTRGTFIIDSPPPPGPIACTPAAPVRALAGSLPVMT
ncbi:hypothetical protein J2850_005196 [Azospirillum picis]|uniref:Uncharacterized protein n=1 Tax=Azospirillum picis TaxID=488438 RepID=A0ABU0MRD0_9PROT|nr:hypothetical protein [Azospirillum picis]MDQ0536036.1 hypothetical protein [Azospirillum picis]